MAKLKVENQRRQKVLTAYGKELIGGRSGTKPAQFLYKLQRGLQSNQNAGAQ